MNEPLVYLLITEAIYRLKTLFKHDWTLIFNQQKKYTADVPGGDVSKPSHNERFPTVVFKPAIVWHGKIKSPLM